MENGNHISENEEIAILKNIYTFVYNNGFEKKIKIIININGSGYFGLFIKNFENKKISLLKIKYFLELKKILEIFKIDILLKDNNFTKNSNLKEYIKILKRFIYSSLEKTKRRGEFNKKIITDLENRKFALIKINNDKLSISKNMDNSDKFNVFQNIFLKIFKIILVVFSIASFFMIFNYFSGDFKKIRDKINIDHELMLNKILTEFKSNRCEVNGHLPALIEKCSNLKKKILLYEKDTITNLTVFTFMIADSINHVYLNIGLKSILIITFIFLFIKRF